MKMYKNPIKIQKKLRENVTGRHVKGSFPDKFPAAACPQKNAFTARMTVSRCSFVRP